MNKAYKYRIYPNRTQQTLLNKTFGSTRFYWNTLVDTFNSYSKESNPKPTYKTPKELKQEFEWLGEVSQESLSTTRLFFQKASREYFNTKRKTKVGKPQFKKKSAKQSYTLSKTRYDIRGKKIRIEKVGLVDIVLDREIPQDVKLGNITVSKNKAGQYFVSISAEHDINHKNKTNETVGVDLGLKEFATLSDGVVVHNPRFFRESQSKLKRMQQHFARKKKGSRRREKCRLKVARLHNKVVNQREWFLHNVTTMLVNNYDVICIEDLNVKGMMQNHKLAKSIADVSFYEFRRQLEYKCEWYGKELVVIGRFEPSSKTCSCCGWKNDNLTLRDRIFRCESCGLEIDRDLNASINIHSIGRIQCSTNAETEVTKSMKRLVNN